MNKGDHVGLASTFEALINQIKTKLSAKADKNALGTAAAKDVGTANGVAELDSSGKVPSSQLPSYVDDVLEYSSSSLFPTTGESDKIYVDTTTNKTYRWSGTEYVAIGSDLALGETSSTAYRGDRGKTAYDFSQTPYTSDPAMDGVASAGSSTAWAKGDHVHPSDTSKVSTSVVGVANGVASLGSDGKVPSAQLPTLGTAAAKDVPTTGNASTTQVVMGNDSRLTDSRNAADVYSWAKASAKPSYTASEVGALASDGKASTAGTADQAGKVYVNGPNVYGNIYASATDLSNGASINSGDIYLVYE